MFSVDNDMKYFMIPINLNISVRSYLFDPAKIVKHKIPIVVDRIKALIRELNGIYHNGNNIGFITNEFGSDLYREEQPGLYKKEGTVWLTNLHQYIPDALIGTRIHVLDYFSDNMISLMTSNDDAFELVIAYIMV